MDINILFASNSSSNTLHPSNKGSNFDKKLSQSKLCHQLPDAVPCAVVGVQMLLQIGRACPKIFDDVRFVLLPNLERPQPNCLLANEKLYVSHGNETSLLLIH